MKAFWQREGSTPNCTASLRFNGYGAHVAGIIAGDGTLSKGRIRGVAPEAGIAAVKVLDRRGNGKIGTMVKGIQWILDHANEYGIRIVNISVGAFSMKGMNENTELVQAVDLLWKAGLVVCVAAGNEGGRKRPCITTPGILRSVITVGSSDDEFMVDETGREFQNYSGKGPTDSCICKPEIVAPGTNIISTNAITQRNKKPYAVKSGTSMSTPIVSGAIALLLEKYPDMTNGEVKLHLKRTAKDISLPFAHQGWGQIHIASLLHDF